MRSVRACRYCHLKDVYVDKNGKAVALEMVREACLWSTLTGGKPDTASPAWWRYKQQFLEDCTSAKGTYSAACSERVAKGVLKGGQHKAWRQCWKPAESASGSVKPADDEVAARVAENAAWYDKLLVQINSKHYLGLYDEARRRPHPFCVFPLAAPPPSRLLPDHPCARCPVRRGAAAGAAERGRAAHGDVQWRERR